MVCMAQWAVVIPADQWATERLFEHDTLVVAVPATADGPGSAPAGPVGAGPGAARPVVDDEILLVAGPFVVGLGRLAKEGADELVIAYTRRAFDEPVAADGLTLTGPVTEVAGSVFRHFAGRLGGVRDRQTWLVSVDLPIEAATPAEAVRQFWSYVLELGPAELPAFVSPSGNELAMQAYVLGAQANQDPEEDED